jgi:cobyrinic acid a,c-diamide synthase
MTVAPSDTRGLIIAAPASGSGKTIVTAAILRGLAQAGVRVAAFKTGPDYIDPAFHAAASWRNCYSLDLWGMRPATAARVIAALQRDADLVIGEGAMGLFDGAPDGTASTADVAALTGWPVVLVIDTRGQGASAAATLRGFATHRDDVRVAGVIFNRVGAEGHAVTLRDAVRPLGIPVLGCIPRSAALALPERHLGLVQAREQAGLQSALDSAAATVARHLDLDALASLARHARPAAAAAPAAPLLSPLGQRIAVASDACFSFIYPDLLESWRAAGAEIAPFSPLAGEGPAADADAIYLPGGYPELHAGRLASSAAFMEGLRKAAARKAALFGECGGYMVLGQGLVDADRLPHAMAGLLPLETSFAARRLHLGYREVRLLADTAVGTAGATFRGHEFHYATVTHEAGDGRLFDCRDGRGKALGPAGLRRGTVCGSFVHLIDAVDQASATQARPDAAPAAA